MTMVRDDVGDGFVGAAALDRQDEPIGEVCHVFVDVATERPGWVSVRVALLGSEVLVPLDDAAWDQQSLHLAVGGPSILRAPSRGGVEVPTEREQERLYAHYGIPSVRTPRSPAAVAAVSTEPVCYSVQDPASAGDEAEAEEPIPLHGASTVR